MSVHLFSDLGRLMLQHIGYTPLHKASFGGHPDVAEILTGSNANLEIKNIVSMRKIKDLAV